MSNDLVTIATYWDSTEANISRNLLRTEEIPAFLENETFVQVTGLYANASGGIKLKVSEGDVERALNLLDRHSRPEDVEKAAAIYDAEIGGAAKPHEIDEDDPPDLPLSIRDEAAFRAMRAALIGIFLFPLQFYVLWLLLKVSFFDGPLSAAARRKAIWAGLISAFHILLAGAIFRMM